MISKKDFNDYIRRDPFTPYGQMGIQHDEAFKSIGKPRKNHKSRKKKNKVSNNVNTPASKSKEKKSPFIKKPKQKKPFLPEVDRWIDEKISLKVRRRIAIILMISGALIGLGIAEQLAINSWISAGLGAIAGLALFPLLIFSVKLAIIFLGIAFVGLILYFFVIAINLL